MVMRFGDHQMNNRCFVLWYRMADCCTCLVMKLCTPPEPAIPCTGDPYKMISERGSSRHTLPLRYRCTTYSFTWYPTLTPNTGKSVENVRCLNTGDIVGCYLVCVLLTGTVYSVTSHSASYWFRIKQQRLTTKDYVLTNKWSGGIIAHA